jgi:cytochrome c oxidase subunit III
MSSSEPSPAAAAHPRLAHHFDSLERQTSAARLGMWLFLTTEVLLFAGLFVAYAGYRFLFAATFQEGSRHLSLVLGSINTIVLITSSLTVALAYYAIRAGRPRLTAGLLVFTVLCALTFLVIKGFEYQHHIETGALPGRLFQYAPMAALPGAPMFFTIYFFSTGLHAFHVLVGVIILSWLVVRTWRGAFSPEYHTPVELGGLYWHLVDLIWIFLFPLLYLV